MAAERTRSLEFAAIGLGQAGGNLAAEFYRRGYRAAALNTAKVDLRGLENRELSIPESNLLYIGQNELDGAGKDPAYGRACIEAQADAIRTLAEREFADCDALFICAGLGGGKGSCVAELCEVLAPLQLPLCALVTLPSEAESGIVKVNAVRAASALIDRPLSARVFVDNQRLVEDRGELDLLNYYPAINRSIVGQLHTMNVLNTDRDKVSLRSFDGEDFRKVLLSGGVISMGSEKISLDAPPMTVKILEASVRRVIDGGVVLASGLPIEQVAYLGVVIVAPESYLRATPTRDLEELAERLKKQTEGGAVYLGLYSADIERPVVHAVAGSLSLPTRVSAVLEAARSEGHILASKIRCEIPALDVGDLEDMQLFRGAMAASPGRKAAPPSPLARPAASKSVETEAPVDTADSKKEPEPSEPVEKKSGRGKNKSDSKSAKSDESKPDSSSASKKSKSKAKKKIKEEVRVADLDPEDGYIPEPEPLPDDDNFEPLPELSDPAIVPLAASEVTTPADEVPEGDEIDYANLQGYYSGLIEGFRDAPNRRAREDVARHLIKDARNDNVEVRAHAVWAMVSLGGRGFKAALHQAASDSDDEIRGLAEDGLRRLGDIDS